MVKTIHILTGPVQSGKTTRLIAWIRYHSNCAGILSPIINEKRHVYSIHHQHDLVLETDDLEKMSADALITIGQFNFLTASFAWAREELREALELNPRWLIIDEIGPLELAGKGLEPVVSEIVDKYERSKDRHLILVVRENLLSRVVSHYNLEGKYLVDESFLEIR